MLFLTADNGFFLGPIAKLFGYLMNFIYLGLEKIGIEKGAIGIAIIIFTLITRLILYPFTVQQQKSSKLMAVIQPEVKAIQEKYEGKKDQASMMAQQAEIKAVYEKYGTSMTGSCVQLLIQMPIIFALYRVIMNIPAYVGKIKEHFLQIVNAMVTEKGSIREVSSFIKDFATNDANKKAFSQAMVAAKNLGFDQKTGEILAKTTDEAQKNFIIDFLYKLNPTQLKELASKFSTNVQNVFSVEEKSINDLNSFCGLNLATAPNAEGFKFTPYLLVPILAGLTQYLSVYIMQKQQNKGKTQVQNENDQMQQTMKSMNIMMPLMSVVFCWGFATGIGIYWIASSVFMVLTQLIVNMQLSKLNIEDMVKKNIEKANKKRAKKGLPPLSETHITNNLKKMEAQSFKEVTDRETKVEKQVKVTEEATKYYNEGVANPDSLFAKANMVAKYNEKHNNKGSL